MFTEKHHPNTFLSLALFLISIGNVYAAPVFLECTFSSGDDYEWKIVLDESNLKVSATFLDTGYTFITNGIFGPEFVTFVDNGGEIGERQWSIRRFDFSIKYLITATNSTSEGKCK
jgi:hypothetical protein